MNINYLLVGTVAIAVIVLIIYLIRRNYKDEKKFEMESNKDDLTPGKQARG